jgi:hypothetical protein
MTTRKFSKSESPFPSAFSSATGLAGVIVLSSLVAISTQASGGAISSAGLFHPNVYDCVAAQGSQIEQSSPAIRFGVDETLNEYVLEWKPTGDLPRFETASLVLAPGSDIFFKVDADAAPAAGECLITFHSRYTFPGDLISDSPYTWKVPAILLTICPSSSSSVDLVCTVTSGFLKRSIK